MLAPWYIRNLYKEVLICVLNECQEIYNIIYWGVYAVLVNIYLRKVGKWRGDNKPDDDGLAICLKTVIVGDMIWYVFKSIYDVWFQGPEVIIPELSFSIKIFAPVFQFCAM